MSTTRVLWFLPILLLLGLLLAGCQDDGQPTVNFTEYFPLTPGNEYTYLQQSMMGSTKGIGGITYTEEVLSPIIFEDQEVYPVRMTSDDVPNGYQTKYYHWSPAGLLYYGYSNLEDGTPVESFHLMPPELQLAGPLTAGTTWTTPFNLFDEDDNPEISVTNEYEILGFEDVTTMYGTFENALMVRTESVGVSDNYKCFWYARGVGLVRIEHYSYGIPADVISLVDYQLAGEEE